jgi:lipopolysaccharide export system protein LptA
LLRPEMLCAQTPTVVPDSTKTITLPDSLARNQTDTLKLAARKGGVETTINYNAEDSIRFDVVTKTMYLFGKAHIDYGTTSLDADQIQINWETSTLTANGTPDSTGKLIGRPFFKDGDQEYEAEKIAYNYKTKRGKISGAVTKQGEGYVHAETVKKNADNTIFGRNAQYTTCDLAHPHYYINASKMKVEPGKKVITGPFNLWIGNVPTPVGFLFGLFPTPKERASGVVIPTFGQTQYRGFYLRNGGYYWAVNDYIGLKFLGDIYSFGGYGATLNGDYYKRYSYRGNFNFNYSFYPEPDVILDSAISINPFNPNLPSGSLYNFYWIHSPEPRPGGGRFSANVNLQSQNANVLSNDIGQRISNTFSSAISYDKTIPNSPISYSVRIYHTQNNTTRNVTVSLPEFTVGTTQLYPLRSFVKTPKGAWYEHITDQFNFTYRLDGKNQLTNFVQGDTLDFFQDFTRVLANGQNGLNHTFNITLGNYKLFKYFTFTPTVNYNEAWYLKRLNYRFDDIEKKLIIDTVSQFSRTYEYRAGASLNTRFYGMYNFKGKIKAIRHVVTPEAAFSYKPDFSDPMYGFYQQVQLDNTPTFGPISHYNGFVFGTPSRGEQSLLNLGVGNSLEMKMDSNKDTITGVEKVKLIDNLSARTDYNFAAKEFNLNIINLNLLTNLLNRVSLTMSFNFDPYQFKDGKRVNEYEYKRGGFRLARFTTATLDVSTDLNPDNWKRPKRFSQNAYPIVPEPYASSYPQSGVMPEYIDFNVKWSLFLGYYTSYFNPRYFKDANKLGASNLTARGTLNPTEKWRLEFSTSYDLINQDLTATRLNIYRDLHCWEMSIGWTPFGLAQGYFVNINVKSAMLKDLKISRNQTLQNRF